MRRAAKVDIVQADIVLRLRQCGVRVVLLHDVGKGLPDLLAGYRGRNVLLETKTGAGKLNALQQRWHEGWRGQVAVVRTFDEAMTEILEACK